MVICPEASGGSGGGSRASNGRKRHGWAHIDPNVDPWEQVEDIDGRAHYRVLDVEVSCSTADIRAAYRRLARVHHPDKGGDPVRFNAIKKAFDVLSDDESRRTYDRMAGQLKYKYIPGVTQRVDGGEDLLLDEFEQLGMHCDPTKQLVVLCEVCGRPGTKECWTCGLIFCDFCTRKQHWKGKWPLHWPLVNTPGRMVEELGKRELEQKRIEDAKQMLLEDPNYRTEADFEHIRNFKRAAYAAQALRPEERRQRFAMDLAKYYMWAQTDDFVYLVVFVPNGFENKSLLFEPTPSSLVLQAQDAPPIIDRLLADQVSSQQTIESFSTSDNRYFAAAIPKAVPGREWRSIFRGDSDGARCLKGPYVLTETEEEAVLEIELPFWIDRSDCKVDIDDRQLSVKVRGEMNMTRTYWRDPAQEGKKAYAGPVDVSNCVWSLDDEITGNGEKIKVRYRCVCLHSTRMGSIRENSSSSLDDGHGQKVVRAVCD